MTKIEIAAQILTGLVTTKKYEDYVNPFIVAQEGSYENLDIAMKGLSKIALLQAESLLAEYKEMEKEKVAKTNTPKSDTQSTKGNAGWMGNQPASL